MTTKLEVIEYKEEFGIRMLNDGTGDTVTILLDSDQWFQLEEQSAQVANMIYKKQRLTTVA